MLSIVLPDLNEFFFIHFWYHTAYENEMYALYALYELYELYALYALFTLIGCVAMVQEEGGRRGDGGASSWYIMVSVCTRGPQTRLPD